MFVSFFIMVIISMYPGTTDIISQIHTEPEHRFDAFAEMKEWPVFNETVKQNVCNLYLSRVILTAINQLHRSGSFTMASKVHPLF